MYFFVWVDAHGCYKMADNKRRRLRECQRRQLEDELLERKIASDNVLMMMEYQQQQQRQQQQQQQQQQHQDNNVSHVS